MSAADPTDVRAGSLCKPGRRRWRASSRPRGAFGKDKCYMFAPRLQLGILPTHCLPCSRRSLEPILNPSHMIGRFLRRPPKWRLVTRMLGLALLRTSGESVRTRDKPENPVQAPTGPLRSARVAIPATACYAPVRSRLSPGTLIREMVEFNCFAGSDIFACPSNEIKTSHGADSLPGPGILAFCSCKSSSDYGLRFMARLARICTRS